MAIQDRAKAHGQLLIDLRRTIEAASRRNIRSGTMKGRDDRRSAEPCGRRRPMTAQHTPAPRPIDLAWAYASQRGDAGNG